MDFSIGSLENIDMAALAAMTAALAASLWLIVFCRRRIRRVSFTPQAGEVVEIDASRWPPLSVVVYEKEQPRHLARILGQLAAQQYPSEIEIIVVADGNCPESIDAVNRFASEGGRVRLTFVPDGARVLGRRKLALSLGIKAASNDCVILTAASCSIPSTSWAEGFGRRFLAGHRLVAGLTTPVPSSGQRPGAIRRFDTLRQTVLWLSSAAKGRLWRADTSNIALSRKFFLENKGFSDTTGIRGGDDDIFISRAARFASPAVELPRGGVPQQDVYRYADWHRQWRTEHLFTGRGLGCKSRLSMGFYSLLMWIWLAATALCAWIAWPAALPLCVCLAGGIAWIWTLTAAWMKASEVTGIAMRWWQIPAAMFLSPFYGLWYRLKSRRRDVRERNYTWVRP